MTIAVNSNARKKRLSIDYDPEDTSPLGYRIVAAGTEWVTPPDSAEREPTTM
jgi:hypothetical protein